MTEKLVITNYSDRRCSPLLSITRLPEEEAYALASRLSRHAGETFTSFSRFKAEDFGGYYRKRLRTEEWLYRSFLKLGGKPKTAHPLYFVLGESDYLKSWFENGTVIRLSLDEIDAADVSFTYGDSMSLVDSPDRVNPFGKETLSPFLKEKAGGAVSFLNDLNRRSRYIEVQLWNDAYLKGILEAKGAAD